MEQLTERLVSLNSDLWQRSCRTDTHVQQHIDDVVSLQMMLKDRDKELARLKAVEKLHCQAAEE